MGIKYQKALHKDITVGFLDHSHTSGGIPEPVRCIVKGELLFEDDDCITVRVWEVESVDPLTKAANEEFFTIVKGCIKFLRYHKGKGTAL